MNRVKAIFIYFSLGLSFFIAHGQQIGNYVNNGSFEDAYDCLNPAEVYKAKYWNSIDSVSWAGLHFRVCNAAVPLNGFCFQYPRTGESFIHSTFFCPPPSCSILFNRCYLKNRLKENLVAGKTYCATFYVNISNNSTYGIDGFGIYFGSSTLDTITHCTTPITYISPQIQNPPNNIITDTLGWVPITGTFVATGFEKYMLIGNFKADSAVIKILINSTNLPAIATEVCIDDASCIEVDLPAYSGPDKSCIPGDSVFIGRPSDFAIDHGCVWYKLPNMTIAIDTLSGIWVKPTTTSTYVVRQQLDCSSLKWDTVVVNMNLLSLNKFEWFSANINLFPNPTSGNLNISFLGSFPTDFKAYSITNTLGQMIREDEINLKNSSFIAQTSDLPQGLYQIHFNTAFGIVTKKFVKTN